MRQFISLTCLSILWLCLLGMGPALLGQTVGTFHTGAGIGFEGITWMPDGTVYTVDFFDGAVYRIRPNGNRQTMTSSFVNVAGGGHDGQGNYYFSDFTGNAIYRIAPAGGPQLFASGGLNGPVGIQLSADSAFLYVANYNNNTISKVNLTTKAITPLASGGTINGPDGIVLADNGDLIVANYNNNRLTRVTPDGDQSLFATHNAGGNMGYIAKAGDYFYVPSITGNSLSRIDSLGNVVHIAGLGNSGYVDGDVSIAVLAGPNGITANAAGDSLLLTEAGRIRVVTNLDAAFPVSIEVPDDKHELVVYPSPFSQDIRFRWPCQGNCSFTAELTDASGKSVFQTKLNASTDEYQLSVPELPSGMYILQIREDGILRASARVIRQ